MSDEKQAEMTEDAQVRRAVEDAAPELGLDLEEKPQGRRMVGALIPAAHSTQDVDHSVQPAAAGEDDDRLIARVIDRWEQIRYDQVTEVAQEIVSDPYVAIAPTWTRTIDTAALKEWAESAELQAASESFASSSSRREVSNLELTYLGPYLACATYRSEEEGEEGVYLAQTAAILRKETDGWRIAAITKHAEVT